MIGAQIGPYRIAAELGTGGMGTVYLGESDGEKVAVKVVHPHLIATPGFFKRFLREAELGKHVRHENVVRTLDVDATMHEDRQVNYMVMEYVEGRSLRELLNDLGTVPEALLREIALQVTDGLASIHAAGIVHRDLKPENILITDDQRVRIMDLGVAKLQEASVAITREGQFAGSFLYAAPEQFRSEEVSGAADLYSLGVVLHELATGANPFRGDEPSAVIHAHLNVLPPPAADRAPELSAFFSEVVQTLLAKDMDQRFGSAQELHDLLQEGERSAWWGERERELRKGKAQLPPIQVARETGVYGRDGELKVLKQAWDEAQRGRGSTIFIEGEAGIGKTRVVDAFARSVASNDMHLLYGAYPPSGGLGGLSDAVIGKFGAAGLEEALRPYLTVTPSLIPAFAALLRHESPPTGSEPLQGDALQAVCNHLLHALAEEKPAVWIVDELHFAPQESRQVVLALARAIASRRALLVVTARPGLPEEDLAHFSRLDSFRRVALGRLSPREVIQVLREAFKSEALAEKLGGKIGYKSDGIPFFLFEMMRGLKEGGFLKQLPDGSYEQTQNITDIQVPSAVKDLVEARLRDVPDEDRGLLDIAALLGVEFDPDLVARVREKKLIQVLERLASLERRYGIVRASGRDYRFDHHQIQEILERGVAERLKEEYHALIADAFAEREEIDAGDAEGEDAVFLTDHYLRSSRPKAALPCLDRALAYLAQAYRNDAALDFADRALARRKLLAGSERVKVLLHKADRLGFLGRRDEEREMLQEALALAEAEDDAALRTQVQSQLGVHFWLTSAFDQAREHLTVAMEGARETGDGAVEARVARVLGNVLADRGQYEEARELYQRSLKVATAAQDEISATSSTGNLGNVGFPLGRLTEALEYSQEYLRRARRCGFKTGEAIASANEGIAWQLLGENTRARERTLPGLRIAREIGDRRVEGEILRHVAELVEQEGDLDSAERAYGEALAVLREINYPRVVADALVGLGRVLLRAGRGGDAAQHLEEAAELARAVDAPEPATLAAGYLTLLDDRQIESARAGLAAHGSHLGVSTYMETRFALWKAARDPADLEDAHRLLEELRSHAPEEYRTSMIENVPLHRDIAAAWEEHGAP